MKIKKKTIILIALVIVVIACNDGGNSEKSLVGTKWKLIGFFDTKKNELKEAEPKGCEGCYTLNFDTDSTAYGRTIANSIYVNLFEIPIRIEIITDVNDVSRGNCSLFYDAIESLESFKLEGDKLKFYYNSDKNYLLYKRL